MEVGSSWKFEVFIFSKNQYNTVIINQEQQVNHAEDLVFHLTSSLKITSICAHLFALYHPGDDLWLCPNQELNPIKSELNLRELKFQLRIRYVPSNLTEREDQAAFDYYFHQIRYDFMHIPKRKFSEDELRDVFGIVLQDIIRSILEENNAQAIRINTRLNYYINNITKYCPQGMKLPKLLFILNIKNKLKESFRKLFNINSKVDFIKYCYINQFLNCAHSFYDIDSTTTKIFKSPMVTYEIYEIIHSTPNYAVEKLMMYRFQEQKVCWKDLPKNREWEQAFLLEEIISINVISVEERKILICLINQPTLTIIARSIGQMKSLISLLSGYYRLIIYWNVNLSKECFSPLINKFRKINCFGPVSKNYVANRLEKTSDGHKNSGLFLLKQCENHYKRLKICFQANEKLECIDIEWRPLENPLFKCEEDRTVFEMDYSQLLIWLRKKFNLYQPILFSEKDQFPELLLCCKKETLKDLNDKSNGEDRRIIRQEQIKKSILTIQNNGIFCTRIGAIKLSENHQEDKVFIKEFIDSNPDLNKEISEWCELKNVAIMNCKGVVLHPLSILFERCHITLREYYSTQDFKLDPFNLTEAAFFLAKALDYLYSQNFNHGFIKFENLYVSYFSKSSLFIKLGDPIGFKCDFKQNFEQPWLPPEYFDENGFFFEKQTSYRDVWAFGTTVWEIFNKGNYPAFNHSIIDNVKLNNMPEQIKRLVRECWNKDFFNRIQPSGVFRELTLILSKLYDERKCRKQYVGDNNNLIINQENGSMARPMATIPMDNINNSSNSLIINSNNNNNHHQHHHSQNNSNNSISSTTSSFYRKTNSKKDFSNGYQEHSSACFPIYNDNCTETTSLDQMEDAFLISESDDVHHKEAMNNLEYIPKEQISILRLIGEGNYGKVHQARYTSLISQETFVAVKSVIDNKICNLSEEIKILTKLRHKNIVKILGYTNNIELGEWTRESSTALVMEFYPLGSLVNFLEKKSLNDNLEMTIFASDIASGLEFLYSKHIIHRDLAARNILVASEKSVKIADFGLAHILNDDTQYQYKSNRGLPFKWHAPESFEKSSYRFESDIWSYAIVIWEMYTFCRVEPYKDIDLSKGDAQEQLAMFLQQGNRLPCPENCPKDVYELMLDCWEYQWDKRPKADVVYKRIKEIDDRRRQNLFY